MRAKLGLCLGLLPLLGADVDHQELSITIAANCPTGQFLAFSKGNLVCQAISVGTATIPTCTSKLLTNNGNGGDVGGQLGCISPGVIDVSQADITAVTNLQSQITQIGTQITNLQMNPPGGISTFVGVTTATTTGKISVAGTDTGIPSATAMCNAKVAGSHMCSVYEMYASSALGILKSGTAVPQSWVYMASWNTPLGAPPAVSDATNNGGPQEGLADNCGGYTYAPTTTVNRKWAGVAVEYAKLQTGDFGLKFHSGAPINVGTADAEPGAPCDGTLPIACCK